jgi:hypothetical protein
VPAFRYILDPQIVSIEMKVDGKRSRFVVPGIFEVSLTISIWVARRSGSTLGWLHLHDRASCQNGRNENFSVQVSILTSRHNSFVVDYQGPRRLAALNGESYVS